MANRVVGVDFGHGVVRGVEVEDSGTRRQRVLRTGQVPVDTEALVSGEVRDPGAVAFALRQLWSTAGFKSRRVAIGMGNSRVLARDLQVPVRPIAQLRETLQFIVPDLIPMPLENAVLDYYPISTTTDSNGLAMYDGMLIAALKDVVLQNAKAIRLAGLELVGVDLIPFALIRMLSDPTSTATSAFVDVGATTTIIAIATGGVPEFVRIVPVGGDDITRSLMELGQLSRDQAEQIKRAVGLSADGVEPRYRPVVELMVARSSELMTSIRDTIQYFADTRQRRVAGITLTGGAARLGRFAETVSAWTRIPASFGEVGSDPSMIVAFALASGPRGPGDTRSGARAAPTTTPPVPTLGEAVVASLTPETPVPAPSTGAPSTQSPESMGPEAPVAKPRKESIWTRPMGRRPR